MPTELALKKEMEISETTDLGQVDVESFSKIRVFARLGQVGSSSKSTTDFGILLMVLEDEKITVTLDELSLKQPFTEITKVYDVPLYQALSLCRCS
jgi:hypothetical protein